MNKARGKSGPLFNFDVHDDVRLLADASVEKDESHAGKVVERSWYQRNKHIFPASRWEVCETVLILCIPYSGPVPVGLRPGQGLWELYYRIVAAVSIYMMYIVHSVSMLCWPYRLYVLSSCVFFDVQCNLLHIDHHDTMCKSGAISLQQCPVTS